jgi:DNA-binding transcriptional LysR family regulator
LADSSLIARKLCPVHRWVVGSPGYFARKGVPRRPRDLLDHVCLGYAWLASGETWHFTDAAGAVESVTVRGPLTANNGDALIGALEAGIGIALQPDFMAWEAVRDGRLITVLDGWEAPRLALHLVTPAGAPRPIRVAVLVEFLAARFTSGTAPWSAARVTPDYWADRGPSKPTKPAAGIGDPPLPE